MAKICLEGGTDVAEVALFCTGNLFASCPNTEHIQKMEDDGALIRFPTGSDGGYLLHVHIDEPIEESILEHCNQEDLLKGRFSAECGNISFGGIESAYSEFKPNKNIRSDEQIAPGLYSYLAYHTEYPDGLIEDEIVNKIGESGMKHIERPGLIIGLNVALAIILTIIAFNTALYLLVLPLLVFFGVRKWLKSYINSPKYLALESKKREVERKYPNIVVHLKSCDS